MNRLSSQIKLYLKILASLVLVAIIVYSADWAEVSRGLNAANPFLLAAVFVIVVVCVIVSACKWWLLLRLHKIPFAFSDLNRWYFIAMFFNNFLPTSIGGDGFRFYRTFRNKRYRSTAFVAIFVERISGILALLALGWFASIIDYMNDGHELSASFMVFGIVGLAGTAVLGVMAFIFHRNGMLPFRDKLPVALQLLNEHLRDYLEDIRGTVQIVAVSIGFHLISISWMYLLTRAIGADISLLELTVVSALVSVVTVIPLSINGIGLVDGAFIYLTGQYGMSYADGLTFMILQRALVLPVSLLGMLLYLADRKVNGIPDMSGKNTPQLTDTDLKKPHNFA